MAFLSFVHQIKVRKTRNPSEKKHLKQEIKTLREELRQREDKAITEILTRADVVLATNTSASADGPLKHVKAEHFDLVVIDEVAQSLEAGCWIPLLRAPRCKYLFGYTKTGSTHKQQMPKLGEMRVEAQTKKKCFPLSSQSLLPFTINLHNFVFYSPRAWP